MKKIFFSILLSILSVSCLSDNYYAQTFSGSKDITIIYKSTAPNKEDVIPPDNYIEVPSQEDIIPPDNYVEIPYEGDSTLPQTGEKNLLELRLFGLFIILSLFIIRKIIKGVVVYEETNKK